MTNNIIGLIGFATRARNICFGADSVKEECKRKKVSLVIVADNSSSKTKEKFKKICIENNIPIIIDGTIDDLSKSIGRENKAIIGIKDKNISKGIIEKYCGGGFIG